MRFVIIIHGSYSNRQNHPRATGTVFSVYDHAFPGREALTSGRRVSQGNTGY